LNRIELLSDVFVWAYERSCQRYTVLKDALPEPDPLRLRYGAALKEVVSAMVRNTRPLQREAIRELAAPLVEVDDLTAIVAMAVNELHHLHEGNLACYGLRLSEFKEWQHTRR